MNGSVMNVFCYERVLLWTWSVMSGLLWTGLFWTDISFAKREQMKFQKPVDSINWILWAPSINLATLTLSKFETYLYAIATSKIFQKKIFSAFGTRKLYQIASLQVTCLHLRLRTKLLHIFHDICFPASSKPAVIIMHNITLWSSCVT